MYNSVALSTFTLLCKHHHQLSLELFHFLKQNSIPIKQLPILPSPKPLANTILLLFSMNLTFEVPHTESYLFFCDWFISPSITSPRFTHVVTCVRISFLFKEE